MGKFSVSVINRRRLTAASAREETYQADMAQQDADNIAVILALIKQVDLDIDSGMRFFNVTGTARLVNICIEGIVRNILFHNRTPAIANLISQIEMLKGEAFQDFEELFAKLFWPIIKVCGFIFFYRIQKNIIYYVNSLTHSPFVSTQLLALLNKTKNPDYVARNVKSLKGELISKRTTLQKKRTDMTMLLYFIIYLSSFTSYLVWGTMAYSGKKKPAIEALTGQLETEVFALLLPILAMGYFFVKSIFTEWDREKVINALLEELNRQFSTEQHHWSARGDKKATTIVYINFSNNRVVLDVEGEEISLSEEEYFTELSIVLIENQPDYMVLLQSGLYISLESMAKLTLNDIKARLMARLKRFGSLHIIRQQQIIASLNRESNTFGYVNNEWGEITDEQGRWTVYCHFIRHRPENLIATLRIKYNLEEIVDGEDVILSIINPQLIIPESHSARAADVTGLQPIPYYPHPGSEGRGLRTTRIAPTAMPSPRPTAPPAQDIRVEFLEHGLRYDSRTYVEATAIIRPMYADWLPAYSHFSYLDPALADYLKELNLFVGVKNALCTGEVYPAIVPKTKEAGVGIKQTRNEVYTNIHGISCLSHYKIKQGLYRIHGRLLSSSGRKNLFIFDGYCLGH